MPPHDPPSQDPDLDIDPGLTPPLLPTHQVEVVLKIFTCDRVDHSTSNVLATENGLVMGSRWVERWLVLSQVRCMPRTTPLRPPPAFT